ncbi:Mur ligase [Obelidium mucronatum]|nr:Mur ligase [Obelidium mucronatum]
MSLYVFFKYSTDVVILETGVGGEYDYTNVIEHPYSTAITSLGVDHPWLLGETLTDIAWHKAGIIKPGVACFTAPQPEEAMMVLRERCFERGAGFPVSKLVMKGELGENPLVELGDNDIAALKDITLGLKGSHQYINAAVAVATCKEWVAVYNKKHGDSQCLLSEEAIRRGLESATWPGRAQTIKFDAFPNTVFYLDGAHTPESLLVCSEWFRDVLAKEAKR